MKFNTFILLMYGLHIVSYASDEAVNINNCDDEDAEIIQAFQTIDICNDEQDEWDKNRNSSGLSLTLLKQSRKKVILVKNRYIKPQDTCLLRSYHSIETKGVKRKNFHQDFDMQSENSSPDSVFLMRKNSDKSYLK